MYILVHTVVRMNPHYKSLTAVISDDINSDVEVQ